MISTLHQCFFCQAPFSSRNRTFDLAIRWEKGGSEAQIGSRAQGTFSWKYVWMFVFSLSSKVLLSKPLEWGYRCISVDTPRVWSCLAWQQCIKLSHLQIKMNLHYVALGLINVCAARFQNSFVLHLIDQTIGISPQIECKWGDRSYAINQKRMEVNDQRVIRQEQTW